MKYQATLTGLTEDGRGRRRVDFELTDGEKKLNYSLDVALYTPDDQILQLVYDRAIECEKGDVVASNLALGPLDLSSVKKGPSAEETERKDWRNLKERFIRLKEAVDLGVANKEVQELHDQLRAQLLESVKVTFF